MIDLIVLVLIIGAAVILDVAALLFGYDSRDSFRISRGGPQERSL